MIDLHSGNFLLNYKELKPNSFDLILMDPPYNCLEDIQKWDVQLDWDVLEEVLSSLLKPNGQIIIFCNMPLFAKLHTTFNGKLKYKYSHFWEKQGMPVNQTMPIQEVEVIALFKWKYGKHLTFNKDVLGEKGEPYKKKNNILNIPTRKMKKSEFSINSTGQRYPRSIIKAPSKPNMKKAERTNHPTQKPLSLIKKLIQGYSNPGDNVLDPFCGSGTTLLACHDLDRSGVGYEIEEEFYNEAQLRIKNYTAQLKLL
jgi:DNA modification methylase